MKELPTDRITLTEDKYLSNCLPEITRQEYQRYH